MEGWFEARLLQDSRQTARAISYSDSSYSRGEPISDDEVLETLELTIRLGEKMKQIYGSFPVSLLSKYGELMVYKKLKTKFPGRTIKIRGGARADILLNGSKIEVKTSTVKERYGKMGWGFALDVKKCRQHPDSSTPHFKRGRSYGDFCYFDCLVCVLTKKSLEEEPDYFIFGRDELWAIEPKIRNTLSRFNRASHSIFIERETGGNTWPSFLYGISTETLRDAWHKIRF